MTHDLRATLLELGLAEALELSPRVSVRRLAYRSTQPGTTALGAGGALSSAHSLFSAVLLGALSLMPAEAPAAPAPTTPTATIASDDVLPAEFGTIEATQGDARVFALHGTRGAVRPLGDNVTRHAPDEIFDDPDGYFLIDARAKDAALQVLVEGREFVLVVRRSGAVEFGEIVREGPADTSPAREVSLPQWDHITIAPEQLFREGPAEPWLDALVRAQLGSVWVLDRVAAAGNAARFYGATATRDDLSVSPGADGVARAWAHALLRSELGALTQAAGDAVSNLWRDLDALGTSESPEALRALCLARDDLESVALVLGYAGASDDLRACLADLDAAAEDQLPTLVETDAIAGDPRLSAAAVADPMAWWAAFALA
jgi:hypothetical protein